MRDLLLFLCAIIVGACDVGAGGFSVDDWDAGNGPDTDLGGDADSDTDTGDEPEQDAGGDADGDSDGDTDTGSSGDVDADTDSDVDSDTDSDSDADGDADSDTDSDSDSDSDTDTGFDTDTGSDTDTGTDTGPDTDTDTFDCNPLCVAPECWVYDCADDMCDPESNWASLPAAGPWCAPALDSPANCEFEPRTHAATVAILLPSRDDMANTCYLCNNLIEHWYAVQWVVEALPQFCLKIWVDQTDDDRFILPNLGCSGVTSEKKCVVVPSREKAAIVAAKGAGAGWFHVEVGDGGNCPFECSTL